MLSFLAETGIALARITVSFYAFWLVWRVLLPALPGPEDPDERIAPFARYFTDPFVVPLARTTHLPIRLLTLALLVATAAAEVGLNDAQGAV